MSTKTPTRRDLNQLINVCCGAHDLVCDCYEPTKHILLHIFSNEEPYKVTKAQKRKIEACLIIEEEDGKEEDETGIGPGELDILFAEDDAGEGDQR